MFKNGLAFGLGITVGVIAVGIVAYYCYKKKKTNTSDKDAETSEMFLERLKKGKTFNLEDLSMEKALVEILTLKELTGWLKNSTSSISDISRMYVIAPDKIEDLTNISTIPENTVLQLLTDDAGKIIKGRKINYSSIDSSLQAILLEQDGLLVVKA